MPMDSVSMCSNTLYMSNVNVGSSLSQLSASTITLSHHFDYTSDHKPFKYEPSCVGITVRGYCHMPMDCISMCLNTVYMYDVDTGSSLSWLSASTMT
jgi:hypothetical protein